MVFEPGSLIISAMAGVRAVADGSSWVASVGACAGATLPIPDTRRNVLCFMSLDISLPYESYYSLLLPIDFFIRKQSYNI